MFASTFLLKEIWNKGIYFVAMYFVVFRNVEIGGYILLLTAHFCANIADIVLFKIMVSDVHVPETLFDSKHLLTFPCLFVAYRYSS